MKLDWRAFYLVQDELKRRTEDEVDALGLKPTRTTGIR